MRSPTLCEKVGADVHDVARGIGLDGRIGRKFLHPGPGFGGSCFPKDTLALAYTAREANAPQTIVEQVIQVNNTSQEADGAEGHRFLRRFGRGTDHRRAGPDVQGRTPTTCAMRRRSISCPRCRRPARTDRGVRSRGHGRRLGRLMPGCDLHQDGLRGGNRRRRPGRHHRMARVPRPRPAPHQGS